MEIQLRPVEYWLEKERVIAIGCLRVGQPWPMEIGTLNLSEVGNQHPPWLIMTEGSLLAAVAKAVKQAGINGGLMPDEAVRKLFSCGFSAFAPSKKSYHLAVWVLIQSRNNGESIDVMVRIEGTVRQFAELASDQGFSQVLARISTQIDAAVQ